MAVGKKTGGRQKGTRNKDKCPALQLAERLKIDPLEILLYFAAGDWESLGYPSKTETRYTTDGSEYQVDKITPELRKSAASDAVQYIVPKKKAIEHSGPEGGPIEAEVVYETQWRESDAPDKENA